MKLCLEPKESFIVAHVAEAAAQLGLKAYVVGGFVRDKLLQRPCKDIDVVCLGDAIALANQTSQLFERAPKVSWFKNFGTAHFNILGYDVEFVGARKESYTTDSRNPTVEPGSLRDDQERRDFTINALAFPVEAVWGTSISTSGLATDVPASDGSLGFDPAASEAGAKGFVCTVDLRQLLDPFDGIKDLQQGILRTPMVPAATFSDDPLRMMRAIRFATQLGFQIESSTLLGIADTAHRIKIISQERITDELNKIILSPKPSIGFDLLFKTGLLKDIFPQMVELAGAEYVDGRGHKDNFYHTIQVLDNISLHTPNLWLRWAAVLHDIAKPDTKRFEQGVGWTFHGHEVVGGRMVPKIFAKMKLPMQDNMRFVRNLVELHLRPISLTKENITDSAVRRLLFDAGDDLESLMLLCDADITSKNESKVLRFRANFNMVRQRLKEVEEKDQIRNWQPPITGELIMETFHLQPCKEVGRIKTVIREAILDGLIENSYEAAFALMLAEGAKLGLRQ